jgi:polyisoprenoid-binding protein YceI
MTRTRIVVAAIVTLFLVGGVGLYLAYDQVLSGDAVPELTLPSSGPTAAASDGTAASADPAASASTGTAAGDPVAAADLAGDWTLVTDGSQAGYRVRERLAQLDADSDAVGRSTTGVTGTATLTASGDAVQVTAATIKVDTTTIASDKGQRDNRLRSEGLQTDTFKTATFTLTTPVDVPAAALTGAAVDVTLHGDLELHGVTKTVDIPSKAQFSNGQIQIQGSISFPLSDYSITAPNIGGFIVSIADEGTLEFLVAFAK